MPLRPELVSNGALATNAVWTFGDDWTWDPLIEAANIPLGSSGTLSQALSITAGRKYQISFDVAIGLAEVFGNVQCFLGGTEITISGEGTISENVTAGTGNNEIQFVATVSGANTWIDNVSVMEIVPDVHSHALDLKILGKK